MKKLDIRTPAVTILRTFKRKNPDSEVVVIASHPSVAGAKEAVQLGDDCVAEPVGPHEVINLSGPALTHKRLALHAEQRR